MQERTSTVLPSPISSARIPPGGDRIPNGFFFTAKKKFYFEVSRLANLIGIGERHTF
jgi:hypothetical protein